MPPLDRVAGGAPAQGAVRPSRAAVVTPLQPVLPTVPPLAGWRARWKAWRDARLCDPGFRRWASAFPWTRPIARRRASRLFDLMSGFVYSQVLAACVDLRLFEALAPGPQPLSALADRAGLTNDAMRRLLAAAASLELVEPRGADRWGLGVLGAPMVGDEAIAAMVRHHAVLYADLRDPLALLRAGSGDRAAAGAGAAMARYWPYADGREPGRLDDAQVAEYSALMSASQPLVGQEVVAVAPLASHRHLLDVGGGEGRFLTQVAAAAPHLRLTLFDLPAVAGRAEARLAAAGLAGRAQAIGGDFLRDPLPEGADLITLVRVLFDHPDERCAALLAKVHAALPPGGTVLVAEPMAGVPGAERMGDAYYSFYLLAMGRGRARTAADHAALLGRAGFVDIRALPTPMPLQAGVLVARRP
jgi:demethylspheroidene O-methyltransferase